MEDRIARVVAIFQQVGSRWALVGAHAIGTLAEPRATTGFDFVVEGSKLRAIIKALEEEFGDLDVVDLGPAIRLRTLDVDLIRSTTHSLFREALTQVRPVADWNVPVPEVMIVLKFLAAVSPWRERTKRMQDIVDLTVLVTAVGREELDGALLKGLAAQVYPGGEKELEALLGRIEQGEPITI
ncbi:MAG: hypothetical protein GY856_17645 [bacterium]|nr:hypothetical protein [bacterium]